jgi:legumain
VKNWAVIVAGSKSYGNYRHQADACHAYQIVRQNGIPPENIIMMMQDDVANAAENPFPGQMFNKPTAAGVAGVDVYDGCAPDYTGSMVDAQLFMDVLTGNKTDPTRTKVLESGPNDFVFVNFADHGGGKIIAMPNGPYLQADVLVGALKTMHTKKMYSKLVFYLEACNSGSMFQDLLPTDMNIYATTAANPSEPSWGTYCPPQDMINGKQMNTCLGDLYSVNWMEDSDTKTGLARRLGDQFMKVKQETNKSHAMEYGTQDFKWSDLVSDFQTDDLEKSTESASASDDETASAATVPKDAVDSRDIDLVLAFYKYLRTPATDVTERTAAAEALVAEVQHREDTDKAFARVFETVSALTTELISSDERESCERAVIAAAEERCGTFSSYSLKFTQPLVALCASRPLNQIVTALTHTCA